MGNGLTLSGLVNVVLAGFCSNEELEAVLVGVLFSTEDEQATGSSIKDSLSTDGEATGVLLFMTEEILDVGSSLSVTELHKKSWSLNTSGLYG